VENSATSKIPFYRQFRQDFLFICPNTANYRYLTVLTAKNSKISLIYPNFTDFWVDYRNLEFYIVQCSKHKGFGAGLRQKQSESKKYVKR